MDTQGRDDTACTVSTVKAGDIAKALCSPEEFLAGLVADCKGSDSPPRYNNNIITIRGVPYQ